MANAKSRALLVGGGIAGAVALVGVGVFALSSTASAAEPEPRPTPGPLPPVPPTPGPTPRPTPGPLPPVPPTPSGDVAPFPKGVPDRRASEVRKAAVLVEAVSRGQAIGSDGVSKAQVYQIADEVFWSTYPETQRRKLPADDKRGVGIYVRIAGDVERMVAYVRALGGVRMYASQSSESDFRRWCLVMVAVSKLRTSAEVRGGWVRALKWAQTEPSRFASLRASSVTGVGAPAGASGALAIIAADLAAGRTVPERVPSPAPLAAQALAGMFMEVPR